MSKGNDPIPGRPRISTNERSVKLVADALEKDRRATCEELSRAKGAKTSQLLVAGPLILHDNARPHMADVVTKKFGDYGWVMLPHALDMSSPDFDLFPK